MRMNVPLGLVGLLALAAAGCSRPDFQTDDADAFVASCQSVAQRYGRALRVKPGSMVQVLGMFVAAPADVDVARRFDPVRPPPVVGSDAAAAGEEADCASLSDRRSKFDGIPAWVAIDAGLSNWMQALSMQDHAVRDLKQQIKETIDGRRRSTGRIADLLGRFAPRGMSFNVVQNGNRPTPSVVIQAVNPLDKEIEAMFLAIDLRTPDGSPIAHGRLTFRPATPLGPGVESSYLVNLAGVEGFGSPSLADVRGNVSVSVKVEDILSGGTRLLGDTLVDPDDGRRLVALSVLQGRAIDVREWVRRVREREANFR